MSYVAPSELLNSSAHLTLGKMLTVLITEDEEKNKQGTLYRSIIASLEKQLIEHILERAEGNQLRAARILGINRNTIRSKIRRLGINPGAYKQ
jgi:two-component system nitrogen regulation response regulator GlnG